MMFLNKRKVENIMKEWLSHLNEFGKYPKSCKYLKTYKIQTINKEKWDVHLVSYEMPDNIIGRGFVNGSLTWSFIGDDVNKISDDDIFLAYCGWSWIFPALQAGNIEVNQGSENEEAFITTKKAVGYTDIEITGNIKIGTSEVFEYSATKESNLVMGSCILYEEHGFEIQREDPRAGLPMSYYLLGKEVAQKR